MKSAYFLDLNQFPLDEFRDDLRTRVMIPSRVSLKDDLDARFKALKKAGLDSMQDLLDALKTKEKLAAFARESGLDAEYLTLLRREAGSYQPKPVRLDRLPGANTGDLEALEKLGIKDTRHLFDRSRSDTARADLSEVSGIPSARLDELIGMSDLMRAYGVGPVFARLLYDIGIHSKAEFIEKSAEKIVAIYERETGKKADFGVNEMQFSLDLAKRLD